MSTPHEFAAAIAVAIISSGIWPVLLPRFLEWKNRKHLKEEEQRREEEELREVDRDTWFRESKYAYARVEDECKKCNQRLERYTEAFYTVLDELDDQVAPMLMLPDADAEKLLVVVRAITRRARASVRQPLLPPTMPPERGDL